MFVLHPLVDFVEIGIEVVGGTVGQVLSGERITQTPLLVDVDDWHEVPGIQEIEQCVALCRFPVSRRTEDQVLHRGGFGDGLPLRWHVLGFEVVDEVDEERQLCPAALGEGLAAVEDMTTERIHYEGRDRDARLHPVEYTLDIADLRALSEVVGQDVQHVDLCEQLPGSIRDCRQLDCQLVGEPACRLVGSIDVGLAEFSEMLASPHVLFGREQRAVS